MKVFSKEKYLKRMRKIRGVPYVTGWPDECDGMPVKNGNCKGRDGVEYGVVNTWCINVPDAVNCKCVVKTREGQKGEKKMYKKTYTMKDFKEKRISVHVNAHNVHEFLRMCEAEGLRWNSGDKPTGYKMPMSEPCITLRGRWKDGVLTHCDRITHECMGLTIVEFGDIVQPWPRYKIVIECDGTTTTARMEINGKEVKTAKAKRNPADKFDWRIGAETAFGRLFGKKFEKPEEKKERPFKVGDRVVCIAACDGNEDVKGKHGKVTKGAFSSKTNIAVEFDKKIERGHSFCGEGKDDHCWYCEPENLRHE